MLSEMEQSESGEACSEHVDLTQVLQGVCLCVCVCVCVVVVRMHDASRAKWADKVRAGGRTVLVRQVW